MNVSNDQMYLCIVFFMLNRVDSINFQFVLNFHKERNNKMGTGLFLLAIVIVTSHALVQNHLFDVNNRSSMNVSIRRLAPYTHHPSKCSRSHGIELVFLAVVSEKLQMKFIYVDSSEASSAK